MGGLEAGKCMVLDRAGDVGGLTARHRLLQTQSKGLSRLFSHRHSLDEESLQHKPVRTISDEHHHKKD